MNADDITILGIIASPIECPQRDEMRWSAWCLGVKTGIKKRVLDAAAEAPDPHAFLAAELARLTPAQVVALESLAVYG